MSRTFHHRKARTKRANGWRCTCWYCIGSKAYDRKNNPPMPDPYELDGLQDEIEDERMDGDYMRCWGCEAEPMCVPCESAQWLWSHPSQELAATIQEHVAYRWNGRPLPFARQHRNNWRRRLTKRFLASRYWRSERHTEVFRNFILDLTRKPLTRR
jgi:hypothetical protein